MQTQVHRVPGPLPVDRQIINDVRTMCRAGAMDSPEAMIAAIRSLAIVRRLTVGQARRMFQQFA